ncbi:MAG: hypothetical protein IPP66_13100 [Anaerolineales bacterium]|nr:hypothetical protein [Anaerolineales bacterium]
MCRKLLLCFLSGLLLFVLGGCNIPDRTEVASPVPALDVKPTIQSVTLPVEPSLEPTLIPATTIPTGVFTLSILVDMSSEPVSREQAQTVVDEAGMILQGLTNFTLQIVDFREVPGGSSMEKILQDYIADPAYVPSNGIIIFSYGDDGTAKLYGGYAFPYPGREGYVNQFVAQSATVNDLYVGVIHFGHQFARCGYGDSQTPISAVALKGECFNQAGTACVENMVIRCAQMRWIVSARALQRISRLPPLFTRSCIPLGWPVCRITIGRQNVQQKWRMEPVNEPITPNFLTQQRRMIT